MGLDFNATQQLFLVWQYSGCKLDENMLQGMLSVAVRTFYYISSNSLQDVCMDLNPK